MENLHVKNLDKVINTTICNLYTLGKENKTICLENFSFKDSNHLGLLSIANMTHTLFNFSLKLKMSKFKLFFYKIKYKNINFWQATKEDGIDVNKIIFDIEKAYDEPGVFALIYITYYEGKKMEW